ncbi:MAG: hypothetical protein OEW37_09490 [Rhodospirillaceae bacterium]|nr:hypothetical protein [Rhodospirillaceae bacterium]
MSQKNSTIMGDLGMTQEGLKTALAVRESYHTGEPVCVPDDPSRILLPEYLINVGLNLGEFDDPLPLAMMATRDPESPMALAAATRMSPKSSGNKLVAGVFGLVGEQTRHPLVKRAVALVSENDFSPKSIAFIRGKASQFIVKTREQYSVALKQNLRSLLEGDIEPRVFVKEFFELTEAGNLRSDVRQRLITSLLLAESVRPGIKFLMLENFYRLPVPTRKGIVSSVSNAPLSRHIEILKEELRWIISPERQAQVFQTKDGNKTQAVKKSQSDIIH